tara:strand:+ start:2612 stop:3202 length:591 start_codon:yes stop_codon:yes gene_type:complete
MNARGGIDSYDGGDVMPRKGTALKRVATARDALLSGDCLIGLIGPRGTGKTQIATELGFCLDRQQAMQDQLDNPHRESWEEGRVYQQKYYVLGHLLDLQKETFGNKTLKHHETPVGIAERVDLLILDEVQEVVQTDWQHTTLTRLIDVRYQNMKRTILIGNLTVNGLSAALGDSIYSRMTETGIIIPCDWGSYRAK